VASLDRARQLLVRAAHGDLRVRYPRRHLLGLSDFHDQLRPEHGDARRQRAHLGLTGPLGAFISAWGGVAMLASAPFDDWWHNTYGLDVRIISPPHIVLAAGFFGIELGTVMLLLAFMNRAQPQLRPSLERLFLYLGGTVLCESMLIKLE
jgi:hypothetical protein